MLDTLLHHTWLGQQAWLWVLSRLRFTLLFIDLFILNKRTMLSN